MTAQLSLFSLFTHASLMVQVVMMILIFLSVLSWTRIFQQRALLQRKKQASDDFQYTFWSGIDLGSLYNKLSLYEKLEGMERVFVAGFKEFMRLHQEKLQDPNVMMEGIQRAMQVDLAREEAELEGHLSILATIQSTSPYIGLFGTVWGIMHAFHQLGSAQQVTMAMVAPGISEALIATAMGLVAAIPAGIAYNRFANQLGRLSHQYHVFYEEFTGILYRRIHAALKAEHS